MMPMRAPTWRLFLSLALASSVVACEGDDPTETAGNREDAGSDATLQIDGYGHTDAGPSQDSGPERGPPDEEPPILTASEQIQRLLDATPETSKKSPLNGARVTAIREGVDADHQALFLQASRQGPAIKIELSKREVASSAVRLGDEIALSGGVLEKPEGELVKLTHVTDFRVMSQGSARSLKRLVQEIEHEDLVANFAKYAGELLEIEESVLRSDAVEEGAYHCATLWVAHPSREDIKLCVYPSALKRDEPFKKDAILEVGPVPLEMTGGRPLLRVNARDEIDVEDDEFGLIVMGAEVVGENRVQVRLSQPIPSSDAISHASEWAAIVNQSTRQKVRIEGPPFTVVQPGGLFEIKTVDALPGNTRFDVGISPKMKFRLPKKAGMSHHDDDDDDDDDDDHHGHHDDDDDDDHHHHHKKGIKYEVIEGLNHAEIETH